MNVERRLSEGCTFVRAFAKIRFAKLPQFRQTEFAHHPDEGGAFAEQKAAR